MFVCVFHTYSRKEDTVDHCSKRAERNEHIPGRDVDVIDGISGATDARETDADGEEGDGDDHLSAVGDAHCGDGRDHETCRRPHKSAER